jgi:bifunctional non-homologous end joining protein LigD
MALQDYHKKRDFEKTREPKGTINHEGGHLFIIQKHAASHLHYDFRLELDGVLLSWAVPKGPCLDPSVKRLAIHVDDHPVEYGSFEGIIPKNQYGGGTVMLWDKGLWRSLDSDPARAYQKGHLRFELEAEKLQGRWDLIRFKDKNWFLIKYSDAFAKKQSDYDITTALPNSVVSNQSLDDISAHYQHIWNTKKAIMLPKTLSKGPFPNTIKPMLASLIHQAPEGDNWLHEVKFDGYRILAFINTKIHLKSRTNNDWTSNFTSLVTALSRFPSTPVIFDGEVTLLNEQGISDFQLLQNTIEADAQAPYVYYIFDILYYDKYDLTSLPLLQRKALLKSLLPDHDPVLRYSDHIIDHGEEVFDRACKLGLEGIISKNIDSKYIMSRSKQWLKIKNIKRQEFVIGGYSQPKGSRDHFGALYLGLFNDQGDFVYVGDVGTGFTQASLKTLFSQLQKIRLNHSPFSEKIANSSKATWVKPLLIAEVEFTEWTQAGHIRHPSFKGLRLDKKPQDVIHEKELAMNQPNKPATKKKIFSITHPEKIVYPEDGITKKDLL